MAAAEPLFLQGKAIDYTIIGLPFTSYGPQNYGLGYFSPADCDHTSVASGSGSGTVGAAPSYNSRDSSLASTISTIPTRCGETSQFVGCVCHVAFGDSGNADLRTCWFLMTALPPKHSARYVFIVTAPPTHHVTSHKSVDEHLHTCAPPPVEHELFPQCPRSPQTIRSIGVAVRLRSVGDFPPQEAGRDVPGHWRGAGGVSAAEGAAAPGFRAEDHESVGPQRPRDGHALDQVTRRCNTRHHHPRYALRAALPWTGAGAGGSEPGDAGGGCGAVEEGRHGCK
ncbi:hypothetical protein ON010_g150 [Phytophthora cinnamomi]|nr:hypothetical protein ON010_g150 [Phytophthora cinnamomi]